VIRKLIGLILYPVWWALIRWLPEGDGWERLPVSPGLQAYGAGARRPFAAYLAGESHVEVGSVEAIKDWLLGCQYEDDEALFSEADFWQHPVTFERLRAGDCEDFALWAWRKLIEIKIDADFVVGFWLQDEKFESRHAWVVFCLDGEEFLFETVARDRDQMIRPLSDVRDKYIPQFGVDPKAKRFGFSGYVIGEKRRLAAKSARRTA
jgi:hypothetical protein